MNDKELSLMENLEMLEVLAKKVAEETKKLKAEVKYLQTKALYLEVRLNQQKQRTSFNMGIAGQLFNTGRHF